MLRRMSLVFLMLVIVTHSWVFCGTVLGEEVLPESSKAEIRLLIIKEEFKLVLFGDGNSVIAIFPIAIGKDEEENKTPEGIFRIVSKQQNYCWWPTSDQRLKFLEEGIDLPDVVKPTYPWNPWGSRRIGLDAFNDNGRIYLHETNEMFWWSIGKPASTGCVRFYPKDFDLIFKMCKINEFVEIVKSRDELDPSLLNILDMAAVISPPFSFPGEVQTYGKRLKRDGVF